MKSYPCNTICRVASKLKLELSPLMLLILITGELSNNGGKYIRKDKVKLLTVDLITGNVDRLVVSLNKMS